MGRTAVVVGAGIGGLATAIGLRDAGWRVTVLEQWPQVVGIGAALGMWPAAQRGLEALGVGDEFRAHSVPVGTAGIYRSDGRRLLRLRDTSRRVPDVRLVSRRTLMATLLAHARDGGGVEIRTGVRAGSADLRAALQDADVLVGADGLRSRVRTTFLDAATAPRYSGLMGWRGAVDGEPGGYGETWGVDASGRGMLFGLTPMEPGRTNFYAAFAAPEGEPGTLAALRERYAGWREPIPAVLAAAREQDVLRNPIHDLHPPLPAFVTGRVAVLGDAAHAMTPHAGRGACEAVLDAVVLTSRLREADRDGVRAALRGYDAERREPAQRIAARSWRMRRLVHATGAVARLRDGAVRAAGMIVR